MTVIQYLPANSKPILALQPWYGSPSHTKFIYPLNGQQVPFDVTNPAIVMDQVQRIVAAGFSAINLYWNGPSGFNHQAALVLLKACEVVKLGFSIRIDKSAVDPTQDVTQQYIALTNFVAGEFMSSPAYFKHTDGRCFLSFFDENGTPDWNAIRARWAGPSVAFLFRNGGPGFSHLQSDGAYGWPSIGTGPQDPNLAAIQTFNAAAAANPTKIAWYPHWSGFDDWLASWGTGRVMSRGHGRTFMQTSKLVPATALYSIHPHDHEEGSELWSAFGVDDGVSVAG